jgi:hypothetical protein
MGESSVIGAREAAEKLGVTRRTVQRWVKAGILVGHKIDEDVISSPYIIDSASVDRLLLEQYGENENDLS